MTQKPEYLSLTRRAPSRAPAHATQGDFCSFLQPALRFRFFRGRRGGGQRAHRRGSESRRPRERRGPLGRAAPGGRDRVARERVDAGASAFGAEGAFVLCVGGLFLSVGRGGRLMWLLV